MNKRGAIQTDIDKSGLHARQHPYDLAFIDVANNAALLRTFDMDLLQDTVFNHRHARFHRRDVDQDLFTHGRVSFRHVHGNGHIWSVQRLTRIMVLPTGYAEMAEQFCGFAQRQANHRRVTSIEPGDKHRTQSLYSITTRLVPGSPLAQ